MPADGLTGDPRLATLAQNGGHSRTHALLDDSPAINAGSNEDGLAFDQRGPAFVRTYGSAPDMGAFEFQPIVTASAAADHVPNVTGAVLNAPCPVPPPL